jgi:non-ribosomal peptide synthetase-like protein
MPLQLPLAQDIQQVGRTGPSVSTSIVNPDGSLLRDGLPVVVPARLHHLFERSSDTDPAALALVCGEEGLSYAELERRANQLAHYLTSLSIGTYDRVGLLFERSVEMYVALLAVLKSGAAFVPLDPSYPAERVAFIADDARLVLLLTHTQARSTSEGTSQSAPPCPTLSLDDPASLAAIRAMPDTRPLPSVDGDALCYILYTSGTTGRPKGVAVNQSSVCNFLAVCTPIYGVTPRDRVYQGMTLAFDFSIEEIWPTFAAGATLVAGPVDHRRLGAGLNDFLIEQDITVVCCVPTLLATLERDIPSLRTLLVGGEACPADLVRRWSRAGRRMLNTYGPTETTVTASWAELVPDRPVTIGRPMPTYTLHILDEDLQPVPPGCSGEICIGGPGVAVGYVNRPELTRERFVPDSYSARPSARLYRTGDLGRITSDGEVEYLGRIDTQVKVRGYRVELSEIEAVLLEDDAVANALVALVSSEGGVPELAAYVLPHGPQDPVELRHHLHAVLRLRLPAYMVPAYIELLDVLPMLSSNKADRSRLPVPVGPRLGEGSSLAGTSVLCKVPETPLEQEIAAAWSRAFGQPVGSAEANFFLDLGGHSLFAALVVSDLRRNPALRHLAIADLYAHPTVARLARHLERGPADAPHTEPPGARLRHSTGRVWVAGALQLVLLCCWLIPWLAPMAAVVLLVGNQDLELGTVIAGVAAVVALGPVLTLLLPVAAKWLLLGRVRPGRYPLWGWFFCRWWLVRKLLQTTPLDYLAGSPLLAPYLRLLGARIGRGCHLGSARLDLPDQIEIGDGASIGYDVDLDPSHVAAGYLHVAPVRIGARAYIGTNAVIEGGGSVGHDSRVAEQSLVAAGQVIPDGETWAGSPSRRTEPDQQLDALARLGQSGHGSWPPLLLAGFVLGFLLLEVLPWVVAVPGLVLVWGVSGGDLWLGLALTPLAGLLHVLSTCAIVALGKRLALPALRPGIYPLRSGFGLRKWLADRLMVLSLGFTNSLYSTLYLLPFLRLLGARVGPRAEVSTVSHIDPDLLTLGPECFVADLAVIGAARFYHGYVVLGETELGERGFVGNAALVPGDTRLPHDSLLGVLSVPPTRPADPGTSWLGSPAIFLPRRQASAAFDEKLTYRPPARLVACRLAIEALRVVLPSSLGIAGVFLIALAILELSAELPLPLVFLALPALYFGAGLLVTLVVAVLKWLVMGRYRPRVEPQWSHFVWRTELITGLYENAAVPWLLHWLAGTPLMAWGLRLFGARVGRRAYVETSFLTEFDLVSVGDNAAVAGQAALQTHLFEDRVMKMSTVMIGPDCTVGPRAVVLYDSKLEAGAELDSLSLAMKGEQLPAGSRWRGIPARLVE